MNAKKEIESQETSVVDIPTVLPLLPTKDLVAFPAVLMSMYLSRDASLRALEASSETNGLLVVVAQKSGDENPGKDDLFRIGVVCEVVRGFPIADGRHKVLLQGLVRCKLKSIKEREGVLLGVIDVLEQNEPKKLNKDERELLDRLRANIQILVQHEHLPEEMLLMSEQIEEPGVLADLILAHYKIEVPLAQALLEELDSIKRLTATEKIIQNDLDQFVINENIKDRARDEMNKGQREYFLREQMKQIQLELGEAEAGNDDLQQLRKAMESKKFPSLAKTEAFKQLSRLEKMHPESSEYALLRTYLDWMVDLPWGERSSDVLEVSKARSVLDREHFGLDKVKDRILEFLSVRKLNPDSKGPILCFVGPPGVGKTSLGKSIAEAMGRKFFRMSLGGMRDEAEIRGHRRTYVGALPGRIIQGIKQAGSCNPVFVLDELDKIGADFRGDPSSALLEVLDPAQNKEFRDHYLNVDFDLSEVLFIATANTTDTIPDALLDRLEVVYIPGYTTEEKFSILEKFLIPRQIKENGLSSMKLQFKQKAMRFLVERYTRESGVRNLEREFASICRKIAREKAEKKKPHTNITDQQIQKFLGPTKFDPEANEKKAVIGLARGLAWTVHGGELMPLEVSVAKGKGGLILTGQLGSVMQESAQAALFYTRSHADYLEIDPAFYEQYDIHVHAPAGATPKDGPSAGITFASALISALSGRKVAADIAMTGEITLRGTVLPIGGLREKALAALRYGITRVIVPAENMKDVEEIPAAQRKQLTFYPVKHINEVLELVLLPSTNTKTSARVVKQKPRPIARGNRVSR